MLSSCWAAWNLAVSVMGKYGIPPTTSLLAFPLSPKKGIDSDGGRDSPLQVTQVSTVGDKVVQQDTKVVQARISNQVFS